MQCTNCGREVPNTAKVCGHCGHRLKAAAPVPQPQMSPPVRQKVISSSSAIKGTLIGAGIVLALATIYWVFSQGFLSSDLFSKDTRVVFSSNRDGDWEIYVMDADGQNVLQLTNNTALDGEPSWSPDKKHIVFESDRDTEHLSLYIMDADGRNQTLLVYDTGEPGYESAPSWSPDGKRIAFAFQNANDYDFDIYVMNVNGGNVVRLTESSVLEIDPTWSPDSRSIAFANCEAFYENCGIVVMDADGRNKNQLLPNAVKIFNISWSPDGRHIVFGRCFSPSKACGVLVMDADGRNMVQLTEEQTWAHNPVWSPDGKQILFVGEDGLYVMDADGSNIRRLTDFGHEPDW